MPSWSGVMPSAPRQTPQDGHRAPCPAEGLHRMSPKPLSRGGVLVPPHPQYAASWAPRSHPGTEPSASQRGPQRDAGEWHRVHPKVHPLRSGERAGSGSLLPGRPGRAAADAMAAKGGRKMGKTGGGVRQKLEGPTLLLRLALGKALRFSLFRFERHEVGWRAPWGTRAAAS